MEWFYLKHIGIYLVTLEDMLQILNQIKQRAMQTDKTVRWYTIFFLANFMRTENIPALEKKGLLQ